MKVLRGVARSSMTITLAAAACVFFNFSSLLSRSPIEATIRFVCHDDKRWR